MTFRTVFASETRCRTQMRLARDGVISPEMVRVAEREQLAGELVREEVARGRMIIPANVDHAALDPMAIGLKARVKINANMGSSPTTSSLEEEVDKLRLAQRWGADTVMDLSTGKRIRETRAAILAEASEASGAGPVDREQASCRPGVRGEVLRRAQRLRVGGIGLTDGGEHVDQRQSVLPRLRRDVVQHTEIDQAGADGQRWDLGAPAEGGRRSQHQARCGRRVRSVRC